MTSEQDLLAMLAQQNDVTEATEATRLTCRVDSSHFGVAERPAGKLVTVNEGDVGIVLGTNDERTNALVQFRGPVAVYIPWDKLEVTGRTVVTIRDGSAL